MWQRIFWAVCAGLVAAVLLLAGGLQALQTAAIASALPFAVIMVFMCYGLLRALQTEGKSSSIDLSIAAEAPPPEVTGMTWQQRLDSIMHHHEKNEIAAFLEDTSSSALNEMADRIRGNGLAPELEQDGGHLALAVLHGEHGEFRYTIRARGFRAPSFAYVETKKVSGTEHQHFRAMAHTSEGDQPHDLTGYTREQFIYDVLTRYARFLHTRRLPDGEVRSRRVAALHLWHAT